MSLIRFDGVSKSFAGRPVLDHLSFSVACGEVYGLLGPNGCGKSTAINILCNLLDPDAGRVQVGDAGPAAAMRRLGYCPQEIALYRDLRPAENLRFFAKLYGLSGTTTARRVTELIQRFGLDRYARMTVGSLSGGWQRRVSIAAALIHEPEVVVLDEPTAAVDVEARHGLWQVIEKLRGDGATILLTTHHLDEADRLCSRIGIMRNGRIAKEGSLAELLAMVPGARVAMIDTRDEPAVSQRATQLGWGVRHYAGKFACLLPREDSLNAVVDAFAGLDVSGVSLHRVSLEHAYMEVIRQGSADVTSL